jgi:hypothetical protein
LSHWLAALAMKRARSARGSVVVLVVVIAGLSVLSPSF